MIFKETMVKNFQKLKKHILVICSSKELHILISMPCVACFFIKSQNYTLLYATKCDNRNSMPTSDLQWPGLFCFELLEALTHHVRIPATQLERSPGGQGTVVKKQLHREAPSQSSYMQVEEQFWISQLGWSILASK